MVHRTYVLLLLDFYLTNMSSPQCKLIGQMSNQTSFQWPVSTGVKQGACISPNLFYIYIDELFDRLKNSGYGCYIGSTFSGALWYAA